MRYYSAGKIAEWLVKFLTPAPLMRLAGFYDAPIRLSVENSIAIAIEDEDFRITGRLDILAVNTELTTTTPPLWIVVIETKNSTVDAFEGLPQLLTYAFRSLEQQALVWGLTTNGRSYQFVFKTRSCKWFRVSTIFTIQTEHDLQSCQLQMKQGLLSVILVKTQVKAIAVPSLPLTPARQVKLNGRVIF